MRRIAFASLLIACHSQSTLETKQDSLPATASATATTTATIAPTPMVTAPPTSTIRPVPPPTCEPTISCGRWSKCRWLEFDHAERDYDVFHVVGSDAGGYGSHYWRVHQCFQEAVGPNQCARYCDAAGKCVDGLTADGACTASGPPTPSPYVCEIRGTECVTKPVKSP